MTDAGHDYTTLLILVVNSMPTKRSNYGIVTAVKAETQEQYELARRMWASANSSCYKRLYPEEIAGNFEGADWYTLEETENDIDMGAHLIEYRIESLRKKKEKFAEYCAMFEGNEDASGSEEES